MSVPPFVEEEASVVKELARPPDSKTEPVVLDVLPVVFVSVMGYEVVTTVEPPPAANVKLLALAADRLELVIPPAQLISPPV